MKFDTASNLETLLWQSRIAELPRAEDRAVLQRLYGGEPPYDQDKAEENNIEVNRNDLSGPNILAQARQQWNQAFLKTGNYFTVTLDSGPVHKRTEWGHSITRNINRLLKRSKPMMEQSRSTGANVMLHGIGPTTWRDRRSPIPVPLPISSLLIPSDTDIDFENLEWFSIFREWTPAQLYDMTHGTKVDPGWNMKMVSNQFKFISEQMQKQSNSLAYQYMPERIEELLKQDKGFWGSDAVPTLDVWDTYFREAEDGRGWYRRILVDWGLSNSEMTTYSKASSWPESRNKSDDKHNFLYTSGKRKYANSLSEILHCQFGDCSAYAPFKYHSVRSLGWMLWGVCDLNNRLYCKSVENAFQQFMWFFRAASNADFLRLKQANFVHLGIIPQGFSFVTAQERFKPDAQTIENMFARNRMLMNESSTSYTQDFSRPDRGSDRTATEVMAVVNSANAMRSAILNLAYTYEEFKYREICRRFCIKHNPDAAVRAFRLACLKDGVPSEMLDVEKWEISAERVLGAGNKTLEMAIVQGIQSIRQNLSPDAQRKADHLFIDALSDNPALAEDMAPISGVKYISNSTHDAELASERLLRGLPYDPPKGAIAEDFCVVWLNDFSVLVSQINMRADKMATQGEIIGMANMAQHIKSFLDQMSSNDQEKEKVREYEQALSALANELKAFDQRLTEQKAKGNGESGALDETQGKIQSQIILAQAKAENARESHAQRTAQKQVSFEMQEARKDRESNAELRREGTRMEHELAGAALEKLQGTPE